VQFCRSRRAAAPGAAIGLGIADLVVFALLMMLVASTGGFTWYVGG
jgi:hypothetical protein